MEKLNQWLTLAANLGVLIGVIFVVVELNQANRIAAYSAESTRRTQFLAMNTARIENPLCRDLPRYRYGGRGNAWSCASIRVPFRSLRPR